MGGGSEQLLAHVGEDPQVAGGVIAEGIFERVGDELGSAGMLEDMVEEISELVGGQSAEAKARSDPAAEWKENRGTSLLAVRAMMHFLQSLRTRRST